MPSPLAKYAHLSREPDERDAFAARQKMWREHGLFSVWPEKLGWADRELIVAMGDRLYGRRRDGQG